MFVETFVTNGEKTNALAHALSVLREIGFFPVMFEIGQNRSLPPKEATQESNAMRATWRDGYEEALRDMHGFFEKYLPKPKIESVRRDFGALQDLLNKKQISQEEYDRLRNEPEAER